MVERRSNRLLRSSFVEIVNVPGVVLIDSEEVMGLHIVQKGGTDSHAATNFPLDTDVHLDGARSAIVGIVHIRTQSESKLVLQQRSGVVRVRCIQIKRRVRLVKFLARGDLAGDHSDGYRVICRHASSHRAAKGWLECSAGNRNWLRRSGSVAGNR